ncbi:FAD-dependent oxidoreductase [Micromonospora sp. NPDC051006]|uniref:FAD-dependent oxidoreductase n=1 Tax=Micromonospora sp. NPDC051006 TaxID=3364283 RepID=UPI0037BA26CF
MRVVIAGYGMAGARLAAELRVRSVDVKVTAFGAEAHPAYNRILLSALLAGKVGEDDLPLVEPPGGVDVRLGTAVTAVDRARRVVRTVDDEQEYDALVLATGARPVLPPLAGLTREDGTLADGVSLFRTLDDCRRITTDAREGATAVVLGGGLLGIEAARGLAERGLRVTVAHAGTHLLERQLDPEAGGVLSRTLADLEVRVRLGARAVQWSGDGLRLADETVLPADLLVVACGVCPDTGLAQAAGLAVNVGVLVDDALRTSDPRVSAIGDCVEHQGTVYGLVAPAWEQAATVADRLTGGATTYRGSRPVTRLKAAGIDLAAMGSLAAGPDAETICFADPARGTYAKVVVRDGRLTGAVLLGDNPTVGTLVQLFDRNGEVPVDRRSLLLGRALGAAPAPVESPAFMPDQAVVCRCNSVSKAAITACWRGGARRLADVVAGTRATTGCGGCVDAVRGLVDWLASVDPAEAAAEPVPPGMTRAPAATAPARSGPAPAGVALTDVTEEVAV